MLSCNEDVALEIEALEATYGEELTTDESGVSMLLRPLVDAPNDAYVQCELRLGVAGTAYPQQSPSIQLQDAKGLGTCRFAALEARLREEAASMLGEMVLGQLFESAKDWLTEHNWPAGEQQRSFCFCVYDTCACSCVCILVPTSAHESLSCRGDGRHASKQSACLKHPSTPIQHRNTYT
eukprot:GHUV01025774.1.p1 GENE.GHUV01025774.1~~GHUV01025774.1.p1  ORF type:complete len:180 (+),score=14.53 GHUV01025774.1:145-684(+)